MLGSFTCLPSGPMTGCSSMSSAAAVTSRHGGLFVVRVIHEPSKRHRRALRLVRLMLL